MVELEYLVGEVLEETVNSGFWPMVLSEGFVVRENVNAFAFSGS